MLTKKHTQWYKWLWDPCQRFIVCVQGCQGLRDSWYRPERSISGSDGRHPEESHRDCVCQNLPTTETHHCRGLPETGWEILGVSFLFLFLHKTFYILKKRQKTTLLAFWFFLCYYTFTAADGASYPLKEESDRCIKNDFLYFFLLSFISKSVYLNFWIHSFGHLNVTVSF